MQAVGLFDPEQASTMTCSCFSDNILGVTCKYVLEVIVAYEQAVAEVDWNVQPMWFQIRNFSTSVRPRHTLLACTW